MKKSKEIPICRRVAEVRLKLCGPRGKAAFAKMLGISPSTYDYYEAARVPPAELLVKIAEVGGVDLRRLLTGEASAEPAVPADHPAVRRAAALLNEHPQAAEPLSAFLDVLAKTLAFPQKSPAKSPTQKTAKQSAFPKTAPSEKTKPSLAPLVSPAAASHDQPDDAQRSWIPILGRSAAGVPRFWAEGEDAAGLTSLGELIARCTEHPPAAADVEPGRAVVSRKKFSASPAAALPVQIVTLRTPLPWGAGGEEYAVAQFLCSAEIKANHPDAFAVRIDGDSMSPEICHGDLVVLSASAPAVAGQPAVVQIDGAVGVTCKVYRPVGVCANLVPINENESTFTVATDQIVWALRVLARVQPRVGN
ncbi:MAG: helix-turn-helix domain-containing protein [Phycisphaerae bacterium]|nr:helix-turn-helix domain-containing protein [Phycisphaerae bacterium]